MDVEPPSRADIEAAADRLAGRIRRTPDLRIDDALTLKLEHHQHSGSFKGRGAMNLLLSRSIPAAGVVAASGGNFGLAIAWAARELAIPATIFVPDSTSAAKRDGLDTYGADVVVGGAYYAEAYDASVMHADETGALLAHAYDLPEVVAGAGTIGPELPDLDTVVVAVGGGGLIGGISSWFRGDVRVIAVETELTPTLHTALANGGPVDVAVGGVCADALGARRLGTIAYEAARRWLADSLLVSDDEVVAAQRWLWDETRVLCEPAAATALAALRSGTYRPAPGERVVALVCGANVAGPAG